jgi:hypothetical protein
MIHGLTRGAVGTTEVGALVAAGEEVRIEVEVEVEAEARKTKLVAIGKGMWDGRNGSTSIQTYHHILLG